MENNRSSWATNFGFLMAAVGSAVGLGNIWGFPYKMGRGGGFTFLIVYLCLALFVGMTIMVSELAMGRKTRLGVVGAYYAVSKKFKWLGWLGVFAPFVIMSFYSVLGGYCIQYMSLNLAELSFGLSGIFGSSISGSTTFGAMLTNPIGCFVFTLLFIFFSMVIVQGGVSGGLEKFNKIGMPALFFMLLIIIIRSLTLPNSIEGLKFMFIPGYALEAGYITEELNLIEVIGLAGGQMFFSLSLAMGAMVTYGSYLKKEENIVKNSVIICLSDTTIAFMAALAVLPAAIANGLASGLSPSEIKLSGPNLLFVTMQDVFSNMGPTGPIFGILFYLLVIIAAITSAISLIEVVSAYFIDKAEAKGKTGDRKKIAMWVSLAIAVEAALVAACGLGSNGIAPAELLGMDVSSSPVLLDCWLDFMDFWSEGIAMPLGAMLCAVMVAWELRPDFVLNEADPERKNKFFEKFYLLCIYLIAPLGLAIVLSGQLMSFLTNVDGSNAATIETLSYAISFAILAVFYVFAYLTRAKTPDKS